VKLSKFIVVSSLVFGSYFAAKEVHANSTFCVKAPYLYDLMLTVNFDGHFLTGKAIQELKTTHQSSVCGEGKILGVIEGDNFFVHVDWHDGYEYYCPIGVLYSGTISSGLSYNWFEGSGRKGTGNLEIVPCQ